MTRTLYSNISSHCRHFQTGKEGLSDIDKLARAAGILLANLSGLRYSRPKRMTFLDWNSLQNDLLRVADIAEKMSPDLSQLMQDTMSTALPAIHVQKTLASLPLLGSCHKTYDHVPETLDKFMYVAEKRRVTMLHSPGHLTAVIFLCFAGNPSDPLHVLRRTAFSNDFFRTSKRENCTVNLMCRKQWLIDHLTQFFCCNL
jgi:hypothetical protein